MKALILASGVGKRLKPLTNDKPKPLIKINGKSIIYYQLSQLKEKKIMDVIITTGYLSRKIEEYVKKHFPELRIRFVHNPKYNGTNYIYSLWLARNYIDDDFILMHGDLIFEKKILIDLINCKLKNVVIIDTTLKAPEKDFKGQIKNKKISKIGINLCGNNTFLLLPLYKLSKESFKKWMNKIDEFIKQGKVKCYAEDALNEISEKIELYPLDIKGKFCMEVDNLKDLKKAKKKMNKIIWI